MENAKWYGMREKSALNTEGLPCIVFELGAAVSMTINGSSIAATMAHVGWKSKAVAKGYVGGATAASSEAWQLPGGAEGIAVMLLDTTLDPSELGRFC